MQINRRGRDKRTLILLIKYTNNIIKNIVITFKIDYKG